MNKKLLILLFIFVFLISLYIDMNYIPHEPTRKELIKDLDELIQKHHSDPCTVLILSVIKSSYINETESDLAFFMIIYGEHIKKHKKREIPL